MTVAYGINVVGNLTNNQGILSGFSSGNYAELPFDFCPAKTPYEIVLKFNCSNVSGDQILLLVGDWQEPYGMIDIQLTNNKLYAEINATDTMSNTITTLSANTDYWVKFTYNGVSEYILYLSTDGISFNLEATLQSSLYLDSSNPMPSWIGINDDGDNSYLNGSIDLNESYIKLNGSYVWKGVANPSTQYNVITYGTLTNNNGVLSNFSASNYATIPLTFNPVQHPYEIVFKINTETMPTNANGIIWQTGDYLTSRGRLDLEVWKDKLYAEFAANGESVWNIDGVTTLSSNTDYWIKLTYNGVNTYGLYLSTDGITWTTEGTATSSGFLGDGSAEYNIIGVQPDVGGMIVPWFGSIDLNESYININGIRWWQGVTSVSNVQTRIQLRHDTSANWTSVNPVLLEGEVGIETDTLKQKVGDGTTAWNSLVYDLGSTAFDTKVNKSGDTMTGRLSLDTADTDNIAIEINNVSSSQRDISFNASTHRTAVIRSAVNNNTCSLILGVSDINNSPPNGITINRTTSGINCTFPNTTCVDGQWTNRTATNIVNGSNITWTSGHNYDLSSYLPNDGHVYEVIFTASWTGSTAGSSHSLRASTDIITSAWNWLGRVAGQNGTAGTCILPVGTGRYVRLTTEAKACNAVYFSALGYRRLGTNS